jgi:hypothetical protein
MECPRGSATRSSVYKVTILKYANEWCRKPVSEDDMPITIHQDKASGGRIRVKIFNDKGVLIVERG